jgi:hypothetical protein
MLPRLPRLVACVAIATAVAVAAPATALPPETALPTQLSARTISPLLGQGGLHAPQSARLDTKPFSMVAMTWRGDPDREYQVRTRSQDAGWTTWRRVHALHEDGPSVGTREARRSDVNGSDLVWVGDSDGVQVRTPGGEPRAFKLVLIDPGTRPEDSAPSTDSFARTAAASGSVPRPDMRSRKSWGADESLRDGSPRYNVSMKQAHIHHTASSNDYGRADVAGILRGMYWYHTQSLGWADIGYNFLVDKFGRIWIGRAGGPTRNVRGAHTLGFNHQSFGVAAIGNFDAVGPPAALARGLVRISAWKLAMANRRPGARIWSTSEGSDRYPAGMKVRLPIMDGHRDTNQTACPGQVLYERLPNIRRRTAERIASFR